MSKPTKWNFRDVSAGLRILRDFLLGRKYTLHGRFPPLLSPRSIPTPEVPRAPYYKYSDQWYHSRDSMHSVKAPVVAPIAEGPPINRNKFQPSKPGGAKPETVCFTCPPTPGQPWWWDGHCYYEYEPTMPPCPPCEPPKAEASPCDTKAK